MQIKQNEGKVDEPSLRAAAGGSLLPHPSVRGVPLRCCNQVGRPIKRSQKPESVPRSAGPGACSVGRITRSETVLKVMLAAYLTSSLHAKAGTAPFVRTAAFRPEPAAKRAQDPVRTDTA